MNRPPVRIAKNAFSGLPSGIADALNDKMGRILEAAEALAGQRGAVQISNQMAMETNRIRGVADPVDDNDVVNMTTLLRFRQCEFLLRVLEECNEIDDIVDDQLDGTIGGSTLITQSYFFGYTVVAPPAVIPSGVGGLNTIDGWPQLLPFSITVNRITMEQTNAAAPNRKYSAGIYSRDKAILIDSGVFESNAAAGVRSVDITPVQLTAGEYIFAFCSSGISFRCVDGLSTAFTVFDFYNQNAQRQGRNSVNGVAGALPSTLSTLTSNTSGPPVVMFENTT